MFTFVQITQILACMKRTVRILTLLLVVLLTSCNTSRTVVSEGVDLSAYRYASIINNETYRIPAELMEYEIQLYDAIDRSNLRMVSDMRIYELSPQEQDALLLVKYSVSQTDEYVMVTVNFIDFSTGRPVVSCKGRFCTGLTFEDNMKGAIMKVTDEISKTFAR